MAFLQATQFSMFEKSNNLLARSAVDFEKSYPYKEVFSGSLLASQSADNFQEYQKKYAEHKKESRKSASHKERMERIRCTKFKRVLSPNVQKLELNLEEVHHAVLRLTLGSREQAWGSTSPVSHRFQNQLSRQPSSYSSTYQDTSKVNTSSAGVPKTKGSSHSVQGLNDKYQGKQLFLWIYKDPNRIHMLNVEKQNPSVLLRDYAERHFQLEVDGYTLASLIPGVAYPIPIMRFATDLNKGFIICLPTKSFILHISDLNDDTFTLKVNPLQTIKDLKTQIYQQKGYSIYIQDLMCDGHIMQNKHLIIDYRISSGSKLVLHLQPQKSFGLHVDTFWGKSYTVEVNPCSSSEDILNKVFRKTLAKPSYREQILKFRAMYQGLIQLEFEGTVLEKKHCLNYYNIESHSTAQLLSVTENKRIQRKKVIIHQDQGGTLNLTCGPSDTWYIIALKIHGLTNIHIDVMKLLVNDRPVDLQCTVGTMKTENETITANLFLLPPPSSLMGKLTITVSTPAGNVEQVQCAPRESIKDVKRRLDSLGVDYAAYYDVLYKKVRLPSNTKLFEYKLPASEKCHMELKLNEFPVQVKHESNVIKLAAHQDMTIGHLLKKIEDKLECNAITSSIIHAGEDLYHYDSLKINETYLFVNSLLHVEVLQSARSLQLKIGDDHIPLPSKHSGNVELQYAEQLGNAGVDVENFLDSLKWFTKWRFPTKSRLLRDLRQHEMMIAGTRPPSRQHSYVNGPPSPQSSKTDPSFKYIHAHNSTHERSMCKPKGGGSSTKMTRYMNGARTTKSGHQKPDEEPNPEDKNSVLPDIGHTNKTTNLHSSLETLPVPRPALKAHSKSTEALSFNQESIHSLQCLEGSKKKLSVRFEVPPDEVKGDNGIVYPWQTSRKIPLYSTEVLDHYAKVNVKHKPKAKASVSPGTSHIRRSSSERNNSSRRANVAVKFQMDL